jgi:hypothetical protein
VKLLTGARLTVTFDWFTQFGESEWVVAEGQKVLPDADLFPLAQDLERLKGTSLEETTVLVYPLLLLHLLLSLNRQEGTMGKERSWPAEI